MKVDPRSLTILQKQILDILLSKTEETKAIQDYNIMMGNLDDPSEVEDE